MAQGRGKSKGAWKQAQTGPAPGSPAAKRKQIFILLFCLLALGGAVAAWIYLIEPPHNPYFLPLCVTEYKDRHIPANAQADQDRETLLAGNYFPQKAANAFASQEKRLLIQELEGLRQRKPNDATTVYVSSHVICDGSGTLFILPGDASIDDPNTWIRFHDVLEGLKACPSKRKLLVLDVARPIADPRLGVLANDVAARIPEALNKVEDPDRLVLCSCSPGQVSLTSEDVGLSVFGYYFELALSGWADGYNAENRRDGRVSAREVGDFVRLHVDRWAARNRKAQQMPALYGKGDFDLAVPEHGAIPDARELPEQPEYPVWLRKGWDQRDQWWADQTFRIAPQAFRRLEASLLRAEQLWRGGANTEQVQRDLAKELSDLDAQAKSARDAEPRIEARSLARAYPTPPKALVPVKEELKKILTTLGPPLPGVKPEEAAAALLKARKDFLAKFEKKPPVDLAWVIFDTAAQENTPVADRVHFLAELLQEAQPKPLFVETLLLRRLDDLYAVNKATGQAWPEKAVRLALQAAQKGERARACEARALPWVRPLLEAASQKRHDGEALLLSPGFAPADAAGRLLEEALDDIQNVNADADNVQAAYRIRDEAIAQLLGIAPYLMNRPDPDARYARYWGDAVSVWQELDTLLAAPPAGEAPAPAELRKKVEQLQQRAAALGGIMQSLIKPFSVGEVQGLLAKVSKLETPLPESYAEIDVLLQSTCLRAEDRQGLWEAERKLARRLHEDTAKLDKDDRDKDRRPPDVSFDKESAAKREQERAGRRAQVAVDLLRLGGLPSSELEASVFKATREPAKPDTWPGEAAKVQEAFTKRIGAQLVKLKTDRNLTGVDRLGRVFPPFDVSQVLADPGPAAELERQRAVAAWKWTAEEYRYEGQEGRALARKGSPSPAPAFYDDAVAEIAREVPEASRSTPSIAPFTELSDAPDLSSSKSAACRLRHEVPGLKKQEGNRMRVVRPDDRWLDVAPETSNLSGAGPFEIALKVERREGAEFSSVPAPLGFLVIAEVGGRTYHHKVTIALPGSRFGQPKLLLSESSKGQADSLVGELYLRPNVRQEIFIFVNNPGDKPRKIAVELKAEGSKADGVRSETVEVQPKATVRVPIGGKDGGAAPAPAAVPNDKAEYPPLASDLQLRLLDMDNKGNELDRKSVGVTVGQPRHYVRVTQPPSYDPAQRRLTVKLKATQPIAGPKCHVKLVLPKDRIPGLRDLDQGAREGDLPAGGEELTLTAENLSFSSRDDPNGYVYLTVDDYERAFVYVTTFTDQGTPPAGEEIRNFDLRLRVPPVVRKGDPLSVVVELDKAPAGAVVEIGIDRAKSGEFTQVKRFSGAREQRVGFKVGGGNGGLLFQTSVHDWVYNPDTRGVSGDRPIRVRMFKKDGEKLRETVVPVIFDDTPPQGVQFLSVGGANASTADEDTPVKVKRARKLLVRAAGEDPESKIKQVVFFWGKPKRGKDGVLLPPTEDEAVRGLLDDEAKNYTGSLDLPADRKSGEISVQFVNGVGLSVYKSIPVEIEEPATPPNEKKGGTLKGVVVFNNLKQPGTKVTITDVGKKVTTTMTDAQGRFTFLNLAPGSYTVASEKKEDPQTKGEVKGVEVEIGAVKEVMIELMR
jgi:hypothetical protein